MPDGSGIRKAPQAGRVRYVQPDGRGIVARKWSVDKGQGPLGFVGERLCKRLIQHGWPCSWQWVRAGRAEGQAIRLILETGPATPGFLRAVQDCVGVECCHWRARIVAQGEVVRLDGPHWLKLRRAYANGKVGIVASLKRGPMAPPF